MTVQTLPDEAIRRCPAGESVIGFTDQDPFDFYDRIRELGSPIWDERAKAWLVLDFKQCVAAERDESRFVVVYAKADDTLRAIKGGGLNIIVSQGEEHERLRKFHLSLLSRASVDQYRQTHIKPIIDFVADRLNGRDRADLARDFAEQIPPRVICSLLGMPYEDDDIIGRILVLNDQIIDYIASGYHDVGLRDRALAASLELNQMLLPYICMRRDNPQDDFISRVWTESAAFGLKMDEAAAVGLCREIYFAGSDTTVHGISNALYLLLSDERLMRRVRDDREKSLPALIEEGLRLFNVVQFRHRICMVDTAIGDVTIKSGEVIILLHAAANRDPAKFGCPNQPDLDRAMPSDHLAFGKGNRFCVGSQLARAEMRDALTTLLDRFPAVRLDLDAPPPSFRNLYMRSMGPLNVVLQS